MLCSPCYTMNYSRLIKNIRICLVLFVSGTLLISCADRNRENPLDPQNPQTGGRPTGINVLSRLDSVFLKWNTINLADITGYRVFRKISTEEDFMQVAVVSPDENSYIDTNLTFEVTYQYQISVFGKDFESQRSDIVEITPGPTFYWVADNSKGELVKLTHDAQHEMHRTANFFNIIDIDVNRATGDVWVVDFLNRFSSDIVKISSAGQFLLLVESIKAPINLAVNSIENSVWVADSLKNEIVKLDSLGQAIFTNKELSNPFMLAVDSKSGACWVADDDENKVIRISKDGATVFELPQSFNLLQAMTFNSEEQSLWVVDNFALWKFNETGDLLFSISATGNSFSKIEADERTNDLWALSRKNSKLVRFVASGVKQVEVSGFLNPRDLAVNFFNHSCMVADSDNDRLVKVNPSGQFNPVFHNLAFADAIAIQN